MILALANQKGGVGKTTCTYFLSSLSASVGKHTLVIDMDPQGNLTTSLTNNLDDTANIGRLWDKGEQKNDIRPMYIRENLWLAGSDITLSYVEGQSNPAFHYRLKHWLDPKVIEQYGSDLVVIDTPPNMGVLSLNALYIADFVLIPVDPSRFAIQGLEILFKLIRDINNDVRESYPLRVAGIVFSNIDRRQNWVKLISTELHEHYEPFLMQTVIPNSVHVREAMAEGEKIEAGPAMEAYEQLYKELLERMQ